MTKGDWLKARLDWPLRLRPGTLAPRAFRVYVVAREKNARHVAEIAAQSPAIITWPLDTQPGLKFELLARMVAAHPPGEGEWAVFADDDVALVRGDLTRFVALAAALSFDIAQPGHDRRGHVNYGLTVSKPLLRARETSFVEIGPIFAVAPRVRSIVLDTFAGSGMGYGLEEVWYALGLRFGVIDEVRMRHLSPSGAAYDIESSLADMSGLLAQHGVKRSQPQETRRSWFAWHRI